jgi:hypothetical protein
LGDEAEAVTGRVGSSSSASEAGSNPGADGEAEADDEAEAGGRAHATSTSTSDSVLPLGFGRCSSPNNTVYIEPAAIFTFNMEEPPAAFVDKNCWFTQNDDDTIVFKLGNSMPLIIRTSSKRLALKIPWVVKWGTGLNASGSITSPCKP